MCAYRERALTLIELLVAISVASILIFAGTPAFVRLLEASRIAGATEQTVAFLQYARSEAIRQSRPMLVTYAANGTTTWRLGLRDDSTCDPALTDWNAPNACSIPTRDGRQLSILHSSNYTGVAARSTRSHTRFDHIQGTAMGTNTSIIFSSPLGLEARVIVSNVGRVRACSPNDSRRVTSVAPC